MSAAEDELLKLLQKLLIKYEARGPVIGEIYLCVFVTIHFEFFECRCLKEAIVLRLIGSYTVDIAEKSASSSSADMWRLRIKWLKTWITELGGTYE